MDISKAAIGIIASVSVVAGAGGAWLATRSHEAPPAATTQPAPAASVASTGVEQSEGVVSDTPAPTSPAATSSPVVGKDLAPATARPAKRAAERRPAAAPARTAAVPQEARATTTAAPEHPPAAPVFDAPRAIENEASRSVPPEPQYVDLVIPSEAVIGLQVETPVSSDTARVEDQVIARVTRDVKVGDRVAIPSGAKAQGEVTTVERGGRLKDRARLGVRFTSIVLADGSRVPIQTDTVFREGDSQTTQSAAKIGGGAIGGAIIGGLLGGAKGAAIGAAAGGGAGSAAVMAGGRSTATLSPGSPVTVRLQQPATVTVDK
jgi:hypothetical protein